MEQYVCIANNTREFIEDTRKTEMKNTALIVIDLQNDITKNYKMIIGRVNEAIDWAAANEILCNEL